MCGICGIVNFKATDSVDLHLLERMTSAQAHRGPDDHGYFFDSNVGLGHRRLSIIDLAGGSQPMFNEDRSVAVVFNGEIYNYAELTQDLIAQGHQFRTRSDTETIAHAYEQHGDECIRNFRGMFAFAVWDLRRKRLLLARDRLGIKPLYYYRGSDFFVFGSEIKSLLQHPKVPREIDIHALDLYLALRYIPGPRTIFKNIFKLQPAHVLVLDSTGVYTHRYWDIDYSQATHLSDSACLEKFEALLEESVRLRLISEVPLGVFLSGGLDSTTTLAMMNRITRDQQIKTFSVGYDISGASRKEAAEADELHFARQAARHFNTEHHEFRLGAAQFRDALPLMAYHLDEPMGDPTCIPLYFISKMARETVTVVLSGEGADETLGGYSLYQRILMFDKLRTRLRPVARLAAAGGNFPWSERINGYIARIANPLEEHYRGVVKGIGAVTRAELTGERRYIQAEERLREIFEPHFAKVQQASVLNRMLYADLKVWLPENLLLKADKMTMATGVELRVPFLDHKLVEFTASLRDSLKIRDGQGKWILRRVMSNEIPPSILQRPKKGFAIPTASWLRYEMRDFIHDTLLSRNSACSNYFDRKAVADVIERNDRGRFSGFQEVWSLIVFEEWHHRFMTGSGMNVELQLQTNNGHLAA